MAQRAPNRVPGIEGAGFPEGVDSYSYPLALKPTQLRWTENAVTRGGLAQARPGLRQRLFVDMRSAHPSPFRIWWEAAGQPILHPQLLHEFSPTPDDPRLVFAISGSVWQCKIHEDGQLGQAFQITGLTFNADADQLIAVVATQYATIFNGEISGLAVPRTMIIIQDGINRAGFWDGVVGGHFNPVKAISVTKLEDGGIGDTLFTDGYNETPIGTSMEVSGNRLFIGYKNSLRACNLLDPTHATEELNLTALPVMTFPEEIIALKDRGISGTLQSVLFVFCTNSVWTVQSGVQQRAPDATLGYPGWQGTPNFVTKIISSVGCNAPKSVILHRGLIYWRSKDGVIVFDSTGTVNSTQNIPPIDNEMAYSKLRIGPTSAGACVGKHEAYVYWGVPVGPVTSQRAYNGHIQVLDRQTMIVRVVGQQGPFSYGQTGWQGVWTGIRPVDFAGSKRPYALSMDMDGVIRIWEMFAGERADNCTPFPWLVETRTHQIGQSIFDQVVFRYFRILLDNILSKVTVKGFWKGLRGQYHALLDTEIVATPGPVWSGQPGNPFFTGQTQFLPQFRDIRSPNHRGAEECSSAGVESQYTDPTDKAFSLLLKFTGPAGLVGYQINTDIWQDNTEGDVIPPETGLKALPAALAGSECPISDTDTTNPGVSLQNNQNGLTAILPKFPEEEIYAAPGLLQNIASLAPDPVPPKKPHVPCRYWKFKFKRSLSNQLEVHGWDNISAVDRFGLVMGGFFAPTGNMSSNTAPAPLVAAASSELSPIYKAYRAFSFSDATNSWIPADGITDEYLLLDLGAGNLFNPTALKFCRGTQGPNFRPRQIWLYGSNVGMGEETDEFLDTGIDGITWNDAGTTIIPIQ